MEKGLQSAENILCHLRRCRINNRNICEIVNLIEHVEKHGCENKVENQRIIKEFVQLLTSGPDAASAADMADRMGCVIWMTHQQIQQKLSPLNEPIFEQVLIWLRGALKTYGNNVELVSRYCAALDGLFTAHPNTNKDQYFVSVSGELSKYLCWDSPIDAIISVMRCVDNLSCGLSSNPSKEALDMTAVLGDKILQLFYSANKPQVKTEAIPMFLLYSLQLANHIASINADFSRKNLSELLGFARAQFHFGVGNVVTTLLTPQKVHMSQQALYDSHEEFEVNMNSDKTRNSGGKTQKARKPRISARTADRNVISTSPDKKNVLLAFEVKTSDSDFSEPENGANHVLYERNRMAKIRLASITLVATLVRTVERKVMYGYWHGLLPCGTADAADNLIYIGQHDPNMRCRCAALQVCAQLLYGSKGFLHQAETDEKRCPTAFIPFSVSLGRTILAIYNELTTILSIESSLPVLTQALKCLAVLVQATPFQKLQKGFVTRFVKHIRPFAYHRDVAIQVSALMVIEFLLTSSDIALDIAEAVGMPESNSVRPTSKVHQLGDEKLDIIDDEFLESDDDESYNLKSVQVTSEIVDTENLEQNEDSWLLIRLLDNMGNSNRAAAASVRIESLQVLTAMSAHFAMLASHILEVGEVLKNTIENPLADVRIHAARCIDACAYQISRHLVDAASSSPSETKKFSQFWSDLMPTIFNHIRRDKEELATVRIALCDALSNIGVMMFENCCHSLQMTLISFLSGVSSDCTDDVVVRAAAVRALAVYVLYPSLRGDFVFVENTADLTLRLVTDTNLLVRVKSFWSLGNISDALLIGNTADAKDRNERISDDLLFHMINASATACSDNDKVRCNAVRAMGNLLRLLRDDHFRCENANRNWKQIFEKSVCKLTDCLRSSGNAKVKWNTCYAISNILRNHTIFHVTDMTWQKTLYLALCHVIVNHSNFKVRINATSAILSISERAHFGNYYEQFWYSVLEAIEQSYHLENFHEYNHRDNLQDQLCLALAHILNCASKDDWGMLRKRLSPYEETIRSTWKRVALRMVPERAAPLLSCPVVLINRAKCDNNLSSEEKSAIEYLVEMFTSPQ